MMAVGTSAEAVSGAVAAGAGAGAGEAGEAGEVGLMGSGCDAGKAMFMPAAGLSVGVNSAAGN